MERGVCADYHKQSKRQLNSAAAFLEIRKNLYRFWLFVQYIPKVQ